ncbi:hypothetical protein V2J09_004692 [Rumex salicifolius]
MRSNDSKRKSARKPFRDISNRRFGSSKSTRKNKARSDKDDPNGSGDTMDRLLLVHSDVSNLFRQIDELVVQVVKVEETDKQGRKEIESLTCVLSEMLSSLKPWVPKLQKTISVQKQQTKMECGDDLAIQSPEPSKKECLVSPSPLVSWRATDCTGEMGKQLFALSPLPRPTTAASKGQSMSKSVALHRFNSSAAVFPSCFSNVENTANAKKREGLLKKQTAEDSPAHVAKKMKMNSVVVLTTPCLKMSPVRSCKLLEPSGGFSSKNFDKVYKSTPFPLGKQFLSELLEDDSSSDTKASPNMGMKYSSSILNPVFSVGNRKKASDASPAWCMSPPKTCVLMDPSDGNNPLKDDIFSDLLSKEDEFEALSGAFKQHVTLESFGSRLPIVESTPMWKEPQSTAYKGRRPGENTLKKELWVRFEAATTNDGLNLNLTFPKQQDRKGFLDMLEEAS